MPSLEMESDKEHARNDTTAHSNALQEINANPTPTVSEIPQLAKTPDTQTGNENLEPTEPKENGIKYSENIVPAQEEDDISDHADSKPARANVDIDFQGVKKKKKKKSKSKRGLVSLEQLSPGMIWTGLNGDEGQANRLRGILC